jgi:hypothetical protein
MPPRKTAAPKPALPYDRKLLTAWKNIGEKAAAKRYASLSPVLHQPGVWEALAATFEAGKMPPAAVWNLEVAVADHVPPRFAAEVLLALPEGHTSPLASYTTAAPMLARALREDPRALDVAAASDSAAVRTLVELAHAEAGLREGGASPQTRAELARAWAAGGASLPGLAVEGGEVTRVTHPEEARRAAMAYTAGRLFGPAMTQDLADAHRALLAGHGAVAAQPGAFPLYPSPDAILLAAPAMTPEELCGFQVNFPTLWALSAAWSVDEIVRAAAATQARGRPHSHMIVNSLAVLAVARDPESAPRVEAFLDLFDHTNQASPAPGYALAVLRRAPKAWRRHFALDVVFAPDAPWGVFGGPIALALLADADPAAAERIATERADDLDPTRISDVDPAELLPLLDGAGPATRRFLLLPIFVGFGRGAQEPPASLDAHFTLEGSARDSWILGYLRALPKERAEAIVRREAAEGRGERMRAALGGAPWGAELAAALAGG